MAAYQVVEKPLTQVIGQSLLRKDAAELVTGQAKYGADYLFPNLLIGKILRSPYPRARILGIDTSRARNHPGVKAVVTHADIPHVRIGRWVKDRPVLAWDEARFIGDAVAAVAAVDEDTAEEALGLIQVEYQELPGVFDPELALSPQAPLVHPELSSYHCDTPLRPRGNILLELKVARGDVAGVWQECDFIYEDSYRTQVIHHGFIQPHEVTAAVDSSGRLTVWTSCKAPFMIREMVAEALNLPLSRLRVVAAAVGGDFGGKGSAQTEPVCALLAMKTGQPVRLSLSRREELTATYMREATVSRLKAGVKKDGSLVALQGRIIYDTGAYCDLLGHMDGALNLFHGPYRIPHVELQGCRVYTNNSPRGHVRAPVAPQPNFAIESHMDMLARAIGMDPVEFRLRNAQQAGDTTAVGELLASGGLKETLEQAREYLHREGGKGPQEGWGVAVCQWDGVRMGLSGTGADRLHTASSAVVKMNEDGTVVLITGAVEQGCGPLTIMAQIVAEVLTIPYESISVVASDTDATPYELATGGSMTTYRVGTSARLAAEDARAQLLEVAAEMFGLPPEEMELGQGKIFPRHSPQKAVPLAQVARQSFLFRGGPILATGRRIRQQHLEAQTREAQALSPQGRVIDGRQYGTHVAKVRVDPETGQVEVLKYFACHDVGRALNPLNIEGQVQGGVLFGLGYALSEEVILEQGQTLTPSLQDYHMPRAMPSFPLQVSIVETPSRYGPYGAKGMAEPPSIPVAAAIANAIYDAVGVRLRHLPMTPERVCRAIKGAGSP